LRGDGCERPRELVARTNWKDELEAVEGMEGEAIGRIEGEEENDENCWYLEIQQGNAK
jgi:hypothetical protein